MRQIVLQTHEPLIALQAVEAVLRSPASKTVVPVPQTSASLKEIAEHAARAAERQAIASALQATRGNKSQAAKALKTDYKTLHLKMRRFGFNARDFDG
jgi:DNA-binding NtrC family response regulator